MTAVLLGLNVISAADQAGASISQEVYPNIGPNPPKPPASPSLQVPPSPVATLVAWVFETWRKTPKVNKAEMQCQYLQSPVVDLSNAIKSTSLRIRYRRNVEQRSSAPVTPSFVSERKRISHFCASSHLLHTSTHCVSSLLRDCVTRYQNHRFPCDLIPPDLWFLQD